MKKVLSLLLTLCFACVIFVGCGESTTEKFWLSTYSKNMSLLGVNGAITTTVDEEQVELYKVNETNASAIQTLTRTDKAMTYGTELDKAINSDASGNIYNRLRTWEELLNLSFTAVWEYSEKLYDKPIITNKNQTSQIMKAFESFNNEIDTAKNALNNILSAKQTFESYFINFNLDSRLASDADFLTDTLTVEAVQLEIFESKFKQNLSTIIDFSQKFVDFINEYYPLNTPNITTLLNYQPQILKTTYLQLMNNIGIINGINVEGSAIQYLHSLNTVFAVNQTSVADKETSKTNFSNKLTEIKNLQNFYTTKENNFYNSLEKIDISKINTYDESVLSDYQIGLYEYAKNFLTNDYINHISNLSTALANSVDAFRDELNGGLYLEAFSKTIE